MVLTGTPTPDGWVTDVPGLSRPQWSPPVTRREHFTDPAAMLLAGLAAMEPAGHRREHRTGLVEQVVRDHAAMEPAADRREHNQIVDTGAALIP